VTRVQPGTTGTGTTTYHYHLDHLGTPRRIADDGDLIVGVHSYQPFGPEASGGTAESSMSLMKYTGHERDVLDGQPDALDYMHARYYSPSTGRFLSVDPVINAGVMKSPQMWNRYSYTTNNPMNRTDPDGRNRFNIDGGWEWHKGSAYTDDDGKKYKSNYTHLLVAQATGTKNGATTFKFTCTTKTRWR
jgi:RHS repeat-associated protein